MCLLSSHKLHELCSYSKNIFTSKQKCHPAKQSYGEPGPVHCELAFWTLVTDPQECYSSFLENLLTYRPRASRGTCLWVGGWSGLQTPFLESVICQLPVLPRSQSPVLRKSHPSEWQITRFWGTIKMKLDATSFTLHLSTCISIYPDHFSWHSVEYGKVPTYLREFWGQRHAGVILMCYFTK